MTGRCLERRKKCLATRDYSPPTSYRTGSQRMKIVKTVVKTLVILILGFLIGVKYDDKDNRLLSLEEKHILRELVSLANETISDIDCELYDNNGFIEKPLVADYITEYLLFSYYQYKNADIHFYCDEDDKCYFSFGLKKWIGDESSNIFLLFSYDTEKQIIDSKSFSCIDVP